MGWEWLVEGMGVGGWEEPPQITNAHMNMHILAYMLIMINMLLAIGHFLTYILA